MKRTVTLLLALFLVSIPFQVSADQGPGGMIAHSNYSTYPPHIYLTSPQDGTTVDSGVKGLVFSYSPDQSEVVYTVETNGEAHSLYMSNADGTNERPWKLAASDESVNYRYPNWSPAGDKILYDKLNESLNGGLYMSDVDGSNEVEIAPHGTVGSFSPDGTKVAYTDGCNTCASTVTIKDLVTGETTKIDDFGLYVKWSPDGKKLLYQNTKDLQLYTINVDGTGKKRLTDPGFYYSTRYPDWSPDGSHIVFSASLHETHPDYGRGGIMVMNIKSGKIKKVGVRWPEWIEWLE